MTDDELIKWALESLIAYEVRDDAEFGYSRKIEELDRDGQTPDVINALRKRLTQTKHPDV